MEDVKDARRRDIMCDTKYKNEKAMEGA